MKNWNHAETELQEFSQHTAIQEPEVETKQPMKVENNTLGKALEAITTSTVKPVQDTPKMSEYQPLSYKGRSRSSPDWNHQVSDKTRWKAKGKEKPAQEVAKRKTQRSQVVEALAPKISRSGRKVKASCKEWTEKNYQRDW